MPRLIFAVGVNEGYYHERSLSYAAEINEKSTIENHFVCLDFLPDEAHRAQFPNIHFSPIASAALRLPLNNYCIQHGEFTEAIPGDPDDVILFTDADIQMQRPFKEEELELMRSLQFNDVVVGYNEGPRDTLLTEARRLFPRIPMSSIEEKFTARFPDGPPLTYNVGAVIARRDTFERLTNLYCVGYPVMEKVFEHKARQQWYISWLLAAKEFNVQIMAQSFHTHGHYALPKGAGTRPDGLLWFNDEIVLLRHHA
jgi:hypothetical protein